MQFGSLRSPDVAGSMDPMRLLRLLTLCAAAALAPFARADSMQSSAAPYDPTLHWEMDYESGVLWRFSGDATPLTYTFLPQMLTFKSPMIGTVRPFFGGDLVLRNRFSLLGEPISDGPEHHFGGATGSGIFEWWDKQRSRCLFFSAGGGIGWLDSKGHEITGAQGEDFNFTWFAYSGARILTRGRMSVSAGAYFQHVSNGRQNRINPGVNAVGPMLSVGWHF
jgi:lipid A 3-O-deacylase